MPTSWKYRHYCFCPIKWNSFKTRIKPVIDHLLKASCDVDKNPRKSTMGTIFLLLLILFVQRTSTQDKNDWIRIDCGSPTSYPGDNGVPWTTDDEYIKTGINKQVLNRDLNWEQLNNLRVFTEQNKNCYTLPTPTPARYLIRATFYYGNYDGLSMPPSFGLEFDGNKWDTVVTTMNNFTYYEIVYATRGDNISVCLSRTSDSQFPFISLLESMPLPDEMYAGLARDIAWITGYRFDYGTTQQIYWFKDDNYNRIWEPAIPSGVDSVAANFTTLDSTTVDDPPVTVMTDAIEAQDLTDAISLRFQFSKINRQDHVIVHLTEVEILNQNQTRSFDFYVNNEYVLTMTPEYQSCTGAWQNTHSVGVLEVELRPTSESTLPPIINAIEVYTASDPLVTTSTSQDDLNGLAAFIRTFQKLKGWSGEPCLPSDTVWQWLTCNEDNPPRVTSIKLAGYSLKGPIPDFSQMEALETIDLSHNSLNGFIPDFLGQLPNLKVLDLSYNDLSGSIPPSLTHNKKIEVITKGNPGLPQAKQKNLGLIIGLCVGIPLALLVIAASIYFYITYKKKPASHNPTGDIENTERPTEEENGHVRPAVEELPVENPHKPLQDEAGTGQAARDSHFDEHDLEEYNGLVRQQDEITRRQR